MGSELDTVAVAESGVGVLFGFIVDVGVEGIDVGAEKVQERRSRLRLNNNANGFFIQKNPSKTAVPFAGPARDSGHRY